MEQTRTTYETESTIALHEVIKATEEVISGDSGEAWYEPDNPFTKDQIAAIESHLKACGFYRVQPSNGECDRLTDGNLTTNLAMKNDNLGVIAGIVEYKKCKSPSFKVVKA